MVNPIVLSKTYFQSFNVNKGLIPQVLSPFIGESQEKFIEEGSKLQEQALSSVKMDQVTRALKDLKLQERDIQELSTGCGNEIALLTDQCFDRLLSADQNLNWDDLDKDLFIPLRNSEGLSLLGAAVQKGDQEKVEMILREFKDTALISAQDFFGRDVLHIAAMEGQSALIPLLINTGVASVKSKDKGGFTSLHWSIQKGDAASTLELAKLSSLRDAWVNPYTGDRYSPLAFAVMRGDIAILETLIQSDRLKQLNFLEPVPKVGNVLHLAIQCNQSEMLAHLLQEKYGKTLELLEMTDPVGRTPLQLAAFLGDLYAIRYLYEQYTRLNEGDLEAGGTAVHYAVQGGQPDAIQLLDYLGASLVSPDDEGRAPLALLSGRKDLTSQEIRCKNLLETLPRMNRTAKTAPPTYSRRPPLNLVFQGGGPKGYAYLGVLKALEDPNILAQLRKSEGISTAQVNNQQNLMVEVKRVAGTSAGAITAALLAVGYNAKELEDPLNKDFFELLDFQGELEKKLFQSVQDGSKGSAIKALLGAYWKNTHSFNLIKPAKELFHQLSSTTELCAGNELLQWVEELIKAKTKKDNCTFGELADLVRRSPLKYKHLHVFSLNVNTGSHSEVVRFSSEDTKWKDLIIADAVRASVSIPGVFTPYHLRFKNSQGKPNEDKSYGQFVDGGLAQNFPIEAFDDEKYQEDPQFVGQKTNRRTMGFSLLEVGDHEPETPSSLDSIKTAKELVKAVTSTYFHAEEIIRKSLDTAQGRVVQVKVKGVTLLDFNVSDEKKKEMEASGKKAVEIFLGLKSSQGELALSSKG
ncbi:patatin-like phospholipase family protein [Rhabdochlamydiaceae symbiont of Dictyostelium giganteum]|uniref:patatin-like phospholipase family protein n=1 Tax=Rhabdochlamydiaceae symbiont of Dictyostelium giganteum TaxID=3342349 RepID=UPI0038500608